MIRGVHHVALAAAGGRADWLEAACADAGAGWLEAVNAWVRVEDAGAPGPPRPVHAPGLAHVCVQGRDIAASLAHVEAAGGRALSGPIDLGTGYLYLYAHAADGLLMELEGAPFVTGPGPDFWLGHVAFVAKDVERLSRFHADWLGLTATRPLRLRKNPLNDAVTGHADVDLSAAWVGGLNLGLEFWTYHHPASPEDRPPESGPRIVHVAFETDALAADAARLLAAGSVETDPPEALEGATTRAFLDPEGNRIALLAFEDPDDARAIARLSCPDVLARVAAQKA
jgi:predicted enzyme related to lactoylglutathione lyase